MTPVVTCIDSDDERTPENTRAVPHHRHMCAVRQPTVLPPISPSATDFNLH